jgi:hypothetical protein
MDVLWCRLEFPEDVNMEGASVQTQHNIHLKLGQCYTERSKVDYTFYPNGTCIVEVMFSLYSGYRSDISH